MSDQSKPEQSQVFRVSGKRNKVKKVKQIFINPPAVAPTGLVKKYGTKWSITTPLTQGRLAVCSVVLGVLALIEGYQGFSPVVHAFTHRVPLATAKTSNMIAIYICLAAILAAFICAMLARQVGLGLRGLSRSSLLPAILGVDKHLVIARFAGRCDCGGKLRFYAKPTQWIEHYDAQGRHRKVTERRLAAECKRNPAHWAEIDPAEQRLSP